jgi:hypothetical protein
MKLATQLESSTCLIYQLSQIFCIVLMCSAACFFGLLLGELQVCASIVKELLAWWNLLKLNDHILTNLSPSFMIGSLIHDVVFVLHALSDQRLFAVYMHPACKFIRYLGLQSVNTSIFWTDLNFYLLPFCLFTLFLLRISNLPPPFLSHPFILPLTSSYPGSYPLPSIPPYVYLTPSTPRHFPGT